MNDRVYKTLEYTKVIDRLTQYAATLIGKEKASALLPTSDLETAIQWQQETDEAKNVIRLKGGAPFGGIRDIRSSIKRSKIGGTLSSADLLDIAMTIQGGRRLKNFILSLQDTVEIPLLLNYAEQIDGLRELEDSIFACIDEQAEVVDNASSDLRRLRQELKTTEQRIKSKLEQITRTPTYQKMLQENLITMRNGRYVIPVKQEHRGVFGGMIHDQSASGATLFIEPEAVVQMTNHLRETKLKEEREIERILAKLSGYVAEAAEGLKGNVVMLANLDFTFAKAMMSDDMKASLPILNDKGYIRLRKARHPLIPLKEVVPIELELGRNYSSIIITGPNTGGKTVTLKTIGLLSLMAMSGLQVPAEEGTEVAVFSSVFADIGDEQSIEQNLSTFSSHLTNIIRILHEMDDHSLVLFDELGAGTDPTEGSALAMAILDEVHQRGARVVATTHYSELKAYAYEREGAINASVEFDVATLRPTYRLLVGVPGRSNAFAIASRLGLDSAIIERAKGEVSEEDVQVERMIASLETNRRSAEEERKIAEQLRQEAEQLRRKWEEQQRRFEQDKEKLYEKAEREAEEAVKKARQEADEVIKELRHLASGQQTGIKEHQVIEIRHRLDKAAPKLNNEKKASRSKGTTKAKPGDEVQVISLNQKGHVVEQAGKEELIVQLGIMKMKVQQSDVIVMKDKPIKETKTFTSIKTSKEHVRTEIDLRGKNIEEAIVDIDRYLDEAVMAGYHQINLIHGKGTGALRSGVQDFLKRHRGVKTYRAGGMGEGGSGVTVVELK
jgi:DNA mismatch repair protein MutS2